MTEPIRVTATASQAEQVLQAIRSTFKQGYLSLADFRAGTVVKSDECQPADGIMASVLTILTMLDSMIALRGEVE